MRLKTENEGVKPIDLRSPYLASELCRSIEVKQAIDQWLIA